jgi:hypothetical protein
MVTATRAETTPLMGGGSNQSQNRRRTPQHQQVNHNFSHRQSPPKQQQQPQQQGLGLRKNAAGSGAAATNNNSHPSYRAPVMYTDTSNEDFTTNDVYGHKTDRRSRMQKCASSVAACISHCIRPHQAEGGNSTANSPASLWTTLVRINDIDDDNHYEDAFNDDPWACTFGTNELDGIWMNTTDRVGNIMSAIVWVLIIYSCITISLLAHQEHLPQRIAMTYNTICLLALACHAKTMFTDPGGIPSQAIPRPILFAKGITTHAMCSHCQTYKPPNTHHCRICNRCISRMDHHCPWMNNCVGAGNFSKCYICWVVLCCVCVHVNGALSI